MRPVPFVTNRPPTTGGFGPPPPCGAVETLSFGTVGVLASTDPARPGGLATPVTAVGAVAGGAGSDSAPDLALVGHLARVLAAAGEAGRLPLILVHGGNTGFTEAIVQAADLCAWLEADAAPLALAPVVFTWPSVHGPAPGDLEAERARAAASAGAWGHLVRALATARGVAGQPRCALLAQSIGVVVCRDGGRVLAASGGALPADLLGRAVLMGGAEPADFAPGGGLDQLARISSSVVLGVHRVPSGGPSLPPNVRVAGDWCVGAEAPARDGLRTLLFGAPHAQSRRRRTAK